MNHAWRWIRNAVLVAILAAAAMTFGCGGLVRTMMLRQVSGLVLQPPSDRDRFFNLVAVDFNHPALCDRIDWVVAFRATAFGTSTPYSDSSSPGIRT